LGQRLHKHLKARVILFGAPEEQSLCARIVEHVPQAVNLCGRTGIGDLAAAVKQCRLLVTNDTGTLHVATAMGTKVVEISVGPVNFRETGPYGDGHVVLQARLPCAPCNFHLSCLRPVCKETITADCVYHVILQVVQGKDSSELFPKELTRYHSYFDEEGMLEFVPSPVFPEDEEIRLNKRMWLSVLEGMCSYNGRHPHLEQGDGWTRLESLLRRASRLVWHITHESRQPGGNQERMMILSTNLRSVEREMEILSYQHPRIAPFVKYLFLRREGMSPSKPQEFLFKTDRLYVSMADVVMNYLSTNPRKGEPYDGNKRVARTCA
jgi:hypothetical protein